ncbi:IS630 family transposase [Mesorhizobium sp. M0518]|uniref:IS630 family transposase n=1 Tax=Mesorhizobium sp. M0518 TaxID=2956956 RepID=UPI00333BE7A3
MVLSVDEKSQIQTLDRKQPGLPLKRARRHDDPCLQAPWHHDTLAALNVLDGSVIGRNMQRHRHQEFIRFLNATEAQLPKDKAVHVILDSYATHKQPKVRAWLARHPRWTFHFVPTSCSWLNAVEGFFAKLTRRRLKNGAFNSVVDLQAAINALSKSTTKSQSRSFGKQTLTTSSQSSDVAPSVGINALAPDSLRSIRI